LLGHVKLGLAAAMLAAVAGCGRNYSPNTYSSAATQQANKVAQGVIAGYRQVEISADGTVGAVTGGAAGGIFASQAPGGPVTTALSTLGGSLIGGFVGSAVEHSANDTIGFEYVVRKSDGELLSVTQKDPVPLSIGQKVLLISGNQARIVPDYLAPAEQPAPATAKQDAPAKDQPAASAAGNPAPASVADPATSPPPAPAAVDTAPLPSGEPPAAAGDVPASAPLALHPSPAPPPDANGAPPTDAPNAAPAAEVPAETPAPTRSEPETTPAD
jgi:outer membrane lipoprotein SlyB